MAQQLYQSQKEVFSLLYGENDQTPYMHLKVYNYPLTKHLSNNKIEMIYLKWQDWLVWRELSQMETYEGIPFDLLSLSLFLFSLLHWKRRCHDQIRVSPRSIEFKLGSPKNRREIGQSKRGGHKMFKNEKLLAISQKGTVRVGASLKAVVYNYKVCPHERKSV